MIWCPAVRISDIDLGSPSPPFKVTSWLWSLHLLFNGTRSGSVLPERTRFPWSPSLSHVWARSDINSGRIRQIHSLHVPTVFRYRLDEEISTLKVSLPFTLRLRFHPVLNPQFSTKGTSERFIILIGDTNLPLCPRLLVWPVVQLHSFIEDVTKTLFGSRKFLPMSSREI